MQPSRLSAHLLQKVQRLRFPAPLPVLVLMATQSARSEYPESVLSASIRVESNEGQWRMRTKLRSRATSRFYMRAVDSAPLSRQAGILFLFFFSFSYCRKLHCKLLFPHKYTMFVNTKTETNIKSIFLDSNRIAYIFVGYTLKQLSLGMVMQQVSTISQSQLNSLVYF